MKIRRIKKSDWKKILALWQNIPGMGLNNIDDSKEGIIRFLKRNPKTCFIAEENGTAAGTIIAGHDGRRGYIYHTAVLPEFRKRGIATELLARSVDSLKKQGFTKRNNLVYRNKVITEKEMIRNRKEE